MCTERVPLSRAQGWGESSSIQARQAVLSPGLEKAPFPIQPPSLLPRDLKEAARPAWEKWEDRCEGEGPWQAEETLQKRRSFFFARQTSHSVKGSRADKKTIEMPGDPPAPTSGSSDSSAPFREVLPKRGLLFAEDQPQMVLCKPKLLPLKSVTLQKLESMQGQARDKAREQLRDRLDQEQKEAEGAAAGNVVSESVTFD